MARRQILSARYRALSPILKHQMTINVASWNLSASSIRLALSVYDLCAPIADSHAKL